MKRHQAIILKILTLIEESEHNFGREHIFENIRRHNKGLSERLLQHHMLLVEESEFVSFFNGQGFRLTNKGHDYLDTNRVAARGVESHLAYIDG